MWLSLGHHTYGHVGFGGTLSKLSSELALEVLLLLPGQHKQVLARPRNTAQPCPLKRLLALFCRPSRLMSFQSRQPVQPRRRSPHRFPRAHAHPQTCSNQSRPGAPSRATCKAQARSRKTMKRRDSKDGGKRPALSRCTRINRQHTAKWKPCRWTRRLFFSSLLQ